MKRYIVFAFSPSSHSMMGGIGDSFLRTNDLDDAHFLSRRLCVDYEVVYIYDLETDRQEFITDKEDERMD